MNCIKRKKVKNISLISTLLLIISFIYSCNNTSVVIKFPVVIPFMELADSGECYYIDDFLPIPIALVEGKSGGLYIRHYSYSSAIYKNNKEVNIMLSFYSQDKRCCALYEEKILPK
jgi:hypothetical protein